MLTQESMIAWCKEVLEKVRALPESGQRYAKDHLLSHYFRTACTLLQFTQQPALARAGFLHGIVPNERAAKRLIDELLPADSREVKAILSGRYKLRSLRSQSPNLSESLISSILPTPDGHRSACLLVTEQLDHIDPDDIFGKFSREFHESPAPVPSLPAPPAISEQDFLATLDFLKNIAAPTAEHAGLWSERNQIQDLVAYFYQRERFEHCCTFVAREDVRERVNASLDLVRTVLKDSPAVGVTWHWHHPAGILRRWGSVPSFAHWRQMLPLAGRISIQCSESDDCYTALGLLHKELSYRPKDLTDTLRYPSKSGYAAIATTLFHESWGATLPAEILPRAAGLRRNTRLHLPESSDLPDSFQDPNSLIQVFAPDGHPRELPQGSRVLNFAALIHSDMVCMARGALVNGEQVDLLHPLERGDVVHIEVGTEIVPLPEQWETKVPQSTVRKIRKDYRSAKTHAYTAYGADLLRIALTRRGIASAGDLDPSALSSYIEDAVATMNPAPRRFSPNAAWWLWQLGLLYRAEARGETSSYLQVEEHVDPTSRPVIRDSDLEMLADRIYDIYKDDQRVLRSTLTVPNEFRHTYLEIAFCKLCEPTADSPCVGSVQDKRLTVHLKNSPCAVDGFPVVIRSGYIRGQYFVVEMINRVGIASEILRTVADNGVDVVEHVGDSLSTGFAVLRFQVRGVGPNMVDRLARIIGSIHGVVQVHRPSAPELPSLEASLPPRYVRHVLSSDVANPYYYGAPIEDDAHFYGRDNELTELRRISDLARAPGSLGGRTCFLTGTLKSGKTSLVNRFLREVQRNEQKCIVARTVAYKVGWPEVAAAVRERLIERVRLHVMRRELSSARLTSLPLDQLVQFVHCELNCDVLVFVDEAISMFASTRKDELRSFWSFHAAFLNTPGTLLILAGPLAPVAHLSKDLQLLLRGHDVVKLKRMPKEVVMPLLRAIKLADRLTIALSDEVADDIYDYTGGNPYWCNLLAHEAFDINNNQCRLVFDAGLLARARERVLRNHNAAFSDRYDPLAQAVRGPRAVIHSVLAAVARADRRKRSGVSSRGLFRAAQACWKSVTVAKVDRLLRDLEAAGALVQEGIGEDWRISSKILRDFILLHEGAARVG